MPKGSVFQRPKRRHWEFRSFVLIFRRFAKFWETMQFTQQKRTVINGATEFKA